MAFTSQLLPGERIFDDTTDEMAEAFEAGYGRGLDLSLRTPEGYAGIAEPFPSELLIPRSEWQARIQEMEERKTRLSDVIIQSGLPCHDQDGVPFCWIHAPTHCVEILRVLQNQPLVLLSATSAGCKIKNFRSQGGWGREGLEYIVNHGVVPQSLWPENKLVRQYDTPDAWEAAANYKVTEWMELRLRNIDEHISCLLRRIPCAVGLNYWGHEVTDCDVVWLDGEVAVRFRNSWTMNWPTEGAGGWSIRRGSKMPADDIVAPRVAIAA